MTMMMTSGGSVRPRPCRPYRQSPAVLRHGRRRTSPSNHRNIYRYARGWVLKKNFRRHMYEVYFADKLYDGDERGLRAAQFERDWLDRHRKRILDRMMFLQITGSVSRTGRRRHRDYKGTQGARSGGVRTNMHDVVRSVIKDMKHDGTLEVWDGE